MADRYALLSIENAEVYFVDETNDLRIAEAWENGPSATGMRWFEDLKEDQNG